MFDRLCEATHSRLLAGKCPWCGQDVTNGQVPPTIRSDPAHDNLVAVLHRSLDIIKRKFPDSEAEASEALPFVILALKAPDHHYRNLAISWLTRFGRQLGATHAALLADVIEVIPDYSFLRFILFGIHSRRDATDRQLADEARDREANGLWIIEHWPRCCLAECRECHFDPHTQPAVYRKAKRLWLRHIAAHSSDHHILSNAFYFFDHHERALARAVAKQGQAVEPDEPWWAEKLSMIYLADLAKAPPNARPAIARKALDQVELESRLIFGDDFEEYTHLFEMGWAAAEAGDLPKARFCAETLRAKVQHVVHEASRRAYETESEQIDGLIALARYDLPAACAHLAQMGQLFAATWFRPYLNSLLLAHRVWERGERDAVLAYLETCAPTNRYPQEKPKMDEMIEAIRRGADPQLAALFDP